MTSRSTIMQAVFNELSERNKDMMILIGKSVKISQDTNEQPRMPLKNNSTKTA